ncbi:MAG: hypothetical protein ACM3NW_05005 [Syntrophomonadaceae bacterium]
MTPLRIRLGWTCVAAEQCAHVPVPSRPISVELARPQLRHFQLRRRLDMGPPAFSSKTGDA